MSSVGIMASAVVTAAAFPVVATAATEFGAAIGTNHVVTAPAGITVGDLLISFTSYDATLTMVASSGWTLIAHQGLGATPHSLDAFARIADGTATDVLTLNIGTGSQDYCAALLRITGHTVTTLTTDIKVATTNTPTASNADPPGLNTGTSKNWLWLAVVGIDLNAAGLLITAMPTNYTQVANLVSASSTTSSALGVAWRALTAQTEDPGAFTNSSRPWMGFTLAVP